VFGVSPGNARTAFWAERLDRLEDDLATAARTVGLRARAFDPSFASYGRDASPTIERATWADTPLRTQLDELVRQTETGWQVISPVEPGAVDRVLALGESAPEHGAWPASRRLLGQHLVDAMAAELRGLGLLIAGAMVLVLFALLRKPRRVAAVVTAPLVALTWTFGTFGFLGLELSAIHVLVATFVAGIGIDDAIFLSRSELRRRRRHGLRRTPHGPERRHRGLHRHGVLPGGLPAGVPRLRPQARPADDQDRRPRPVSHRQPG